MYEFTKTASNYVQNFPKGGGELLCLVLESPGGGGGASVKKVWGREAGSIAFVALFWIIYMRLQKEARFWGNSSYPNFLGIFYAR